MPHKVSFENFFIVISMFVLISTSVRVVDAEREESIHGMIHDHIGHSHAHRRPKEPACGACLDSRMIQHYELRGCIPVLHAQCKCPSRFRCPVDIAPKMGGIKKTFEGRSYSSPSHEHIKSGSGRASSNLDPATNCFYNGTTYELLSSVRTSDPCRVCICAYLADGSVGIECDGRVECQAESDNTDGLEPEKSSVSPIANVYSGRTGKLLAGAVAVPELRLDCYDFYEHDVCCARRACAPVDARNGRAMISGQFCNYLDRQYRLGERISLMDGLVSALLSEPTLTASRTDDNGSTPETAGNGSQLERENTIQDIDNILPDGFYNQLTCMNCICTGSWNNSAIQKRKLSELSSEWLLQSMGDSCRIQSCEMQFDPKFRSGCIPVYEDNNCCPVDFLCPARSGSLALKIRGMDSGSKLCRFEGRKYPVGSDLYLSQHHNAAPCIDCTCLVPPDFTCTRRKNCNIKKSTPQPIGGNITA